MAQCAVVLHQGMLLLKLDLSFGILYQAFSDAHSESLDVSSSNISLN